MTATRERQGQQPVEAIDQPRGELIVRDEALQFGSEGQLAGILSRPALPAQLEAAARQRHAPALACLILNAGVLHRVGPHRLHVTLARRIAAAGIATLRLDLGGIGDSITTSDAASFRQSAVADTRVAMTGLTETVAAGRFILFGVCSGADNSLATALIDDRVAGVVLVDPPAYPTLLGQLRFLRARIAERGRASEVVRWGARVIERRLRLALAMLGRPAADDPPAEGRELPPAEAFGKQLTALVERGVRVFVIYSGIHGPRYNHVDQLFEVFPRLRGRVDHAYFPTANHTFTELATQRELLAAVTGWIAKRFL